MERGGALTVTGADTADMLSLAYGLCAAAFAVVLAIALLRRRHLPDGRAAAVAVASAVTVAWALAVASQAVPVGQVVILDVLRVASILVVLAAVARLWRGRIIALAGTALGVIAAAVVAGIGVQMVSAHALTGVAAPVAPTVLLVLSVAGLALVETILRTHDAAGRWVVKHLCLGVGVMLAYDVYLFAEALLFSGIDPHLYVARGLVGALCAVPVAVSLFRKPVAGGRRIQPSRDILLKSSIFLAAGVYLLVMALAGYWIREVGGRWGPVTQAGFLVGSLLLLGVLFLSNTTWAGLRVWFAKNFFSHRYDYRHEWLRFTRAVAGAEDEGADALHMRIVRATCDIVDGTAGGLWMRQERDRAFLPTAVWNLPETVPAVVDDAPLPDFLRRREWVVDLAEMERDPARYGFEPPAWLAGIGAWVVLPLVIRGDVIGFLVVAEPRVRRRLTWEDFDILKTVGRHAAATLATETALNELSDARRLEAFSKRTAFLVHDVKNVVSQLDLMLKNAERVGDDPDFQKDLLDTTAGAVAKLRALLAELKRNRGQAEAGPMPAPTPPPAAPDPAPASAPTPESPPEPPAAPAGPDVVAQVAEAVTRWRRRKPDMRVRLDADGDDLPAPDPAAFRAVLDHLVQNSIEAAGPGGSVEVSVGRSGGAVTVAVSDDGAGMDPAFVRKRLFRPLETSKDDGYGLGAFQAREMVRDMGGRLDVMTEPGRGTTMTIVFAPEAQARPVARTEAV